MRCSTIGNDCVGNLYTYFLGNRERPIHKWQHYFPVYERHFAPFAGRPCLFFEIGAGAGGSAQMWKRYFGPYAKIVSIDINPACKSFEESQIDVRIGSQDDVAFLSSVIEEFGQPDIVLDDGSHMMNHIISSFNFLYPRLSRQGIYLVEDLHTAYWDEYGGGVRKEGTFIELCKNLIDELNADHARGVVQPTDFTKATTSICFYDSIVVFEKSKFISKESIMTGNE
jgi:hypothetical protein|uniref:Class I SAM-dependent methyltransferase n=1 Tax=Acidicaldus sp. TaxID=1872105 RepID=A0A8J4HB44_9PROT